MGFRNDIARVDVMATLTPVSTAIGGGEGNGGHPRSADFALIAMVKSVCEASVDMLIFGEAPRTIAYFDQLLSDQKLRAQLTPSARAKLWCR